MVLTAKGLTVLNAVPTVLSKQAGRSNRHSSDASREPSASGKDESLSTESRGKRIMNAIGKNALEVATTIVREVISESAKHALGG